MLTKTPYSPPISPGMPKYTPLPPGLPGLPGIRYNIVVALYIGYSRSYIVYASSSFYYSYRYDWYIV